MVTTNHGLDKLSGCSSAVGPEESGYSTAMAYIQGAVVQYYRDNITIQAKNCR